MNSNTCLTTALQLCDLLLQSNVKVCLNYWEGIQSKCLSVNNLLQRLLKQDRLMNDDDGKVQDMLVALGRVKSLQMLLSKEDLINLEFTSFEDILELDRELRTRFYQLKAIFYLGTPSKQILGPIIPTDSDKLEWDAYQVERNNVMNKLKYSLAAAMPLPQSLQDYLYEEEELDSAELEDVVRNINSSENIILSLLAKATDVDDARKKLALIKQYVDKSFIKPVIKISDGDFVEDSQVIPLQKMDNNFKKELSAISALNICANIVKLHGYFNKDSANFAVTNFSQSNSLLKVLGPNSPSNISTPLGESAKLHIAIGIVNGLAIIHNLGLTHATLKSQNVYLQKHFSPLIGGDFDLMKTVHESAHESSNDACLWYSRAPETLAPTLLFSSQSDIWSLGVILWELFTEKKPYNEETDISTIKAFIKENLLSKNLIGINERLSKVILSCLDSNPAKRPTAQQVLRDLSKIQSYNNTPEVIFSTIASTTDQYGNTYLDNAASKDDVNLVKWLAFEANVEFEALNHKFKMAQYIARFKCHTKVANWLSNLNLFKAVGNGDLSLVKWLIAKKNLSVNTIDNFGYTALHKATSNGHTNIVQWLLNQGKAEVDLPSKNGYTPLHLAARKGHFEVAKCLVLDGRADVNKVDKFGVTALHEATSNGHAELAQWLIVNANADVNREDKDGWTALHLAAINGRMKIIKCLVKHGNAKIDATCKDGTTAVYRAALNGKFKVVKFLVEEGSADVNIKDDIGGSALGGAASKGHVELVKWLVSKGGANVNEADENGLTPLHKAAEKGNLEMVKYLVMVGGANVEKVNNNGMTALHIANAAGNSEVSQWLSAKSNEKIIVDMTFPPTKEIST